MVNLFFDTSAIVKHYNPELGTAQVDSLLESGSIAISRLTVVEFHSSLAKKVRMGHLTSDEFQIASRLFRDDIFAKRLNVVRLKIAHYESAVGLIRRIGPTQNLRTLDALQLSVVLSLNEPSRPVGFVCADQALCAIASSEGLTVVNPEV